MKKCSKCKEEKELTEFHKNTPSCKRCRADDAKLYYIKNRDKILSYQKLNHLNNPHIKRNYAIKNIDKLKAKRDIRYINKKEELNKNSREYYYKNIGTLREKNKLYRQQNKEKIYLMNKNYKIKNPEKVELARVKYISNNKEKIKLYKLNNKNKLSKQASERNKKRRSKDPIFKLKANLGNRLRSALLRRGWSKNSSTQTILGCSYQFFMLWIEKQFTKGMTWGNRNEWHIDHKIPLASAKTEQEVIELCHYTNMQPLWIIDNIIKKDKIFPIQTSLLV